VYVVLFKGKGTITGRRINLFGSKGKKHLLFTGKKRDKEGNLVGKLYSFRNVLSEEVTR